VNERDGVGAIGLVDIACTRPLVRQRILAWTRDALTVERTACADAFAAFKVDDEVDQ